MPTRRELGWLALVVGIALLVVATFERVDPRLSVTAGALSLALAIYFARASARQRRELEVLRRASERSRHEEVEAALESREQQLRKTQKLEAIGKLAGGVAHDFNNLLTVIVGHGGLQRAILVREGQSTEHIDIVLDAAKRAGALTRQLLAFGGKQRLHPTVVHVNRLVADMERMLRRVLPDHIELRTELDPDAGAIVADAGQVEQVLMNLVVNARDALPSGGRIRIRTERHVKPDHSTRTALVVEDDGVGMSSEVKAHAFDPFFTTKPEGEGTGLGLSTVYGIVKQSEGDIELRSVEGKGTTVVVLFDTATAEVTGSEPPQSIVPGPVHGRAHNAAFTVLLAEDRSDVRSLVERTLEEAGYGVLSAADGTEALQLARRHAREIDVLVTDVMMPGLTGPELYGALKVLKPDVRAVLMSGHPGDALADGGIDPDEVAFLEKPFSNARLLAEVEKALGERRRGALRSIDGGG